MKNTPDSFRVLSYDGQQYQFDYIAFSDLLASKASKPKKGDRKTGISQNTLMNKIADELDISLEAVIRWKRGYNGPKDIDSVIKCANVLDIDVLSLLKPLETIQEDEKLNEKEKNVIEDVFCKCVEAIYCFAERFKQYTEDLRLNTSLKHKAEEDFVSSIEEVHRFVNKSALLITDSVRYRLHRLLNDLCDIDFAMPIPDRWEKIEESMGNNIDSYTLRFYYYYYQRTSLNDNIWYLTDEQEIAEKMNYLYTPIPNNYYDNVNVDGIPLDENNDPIQMNGFGITDFTNFEITPNILYKDMMTRLLRDVFMHDFPGLINCV